MVAMETDTIARLFEPSHTDKSQERVGEGDGNFAANQASELNMLTSTEGNCSTMQVKHPLGNP